MYGGGKALHARCATLAAFRTGITIDTTSPSLSPLAPPQRKPGISFLLAHPAHLIALGFGSGLAPKAAGTAGTLWAWLVFVLLDPWLSEAAWGALLLAALLAGWWACSITARDLGHCDSNSIVWDEVLGFWLVLWLLMPAGFIAQCAAFALFRYFDIAKPGPVAWAETLFEPREGQSRFGYRHGFSILFDDLVAALCTLLVIALWSRW